MTLREFHNGLRVLASIDRHEVPFLSVAHWERFRGDPYRFFIRADDPTADAIWAVIIRRTTGA